MPIRKILCVVESEPKDDAVMISYPFHDGKTYLMPMYTLAVSGKDEAGRDANKSFDVLRFGVKRGSANASPRVVGLADAQEHTIKQWLPEYRLHSAQSSEIGAWQVYDNFLIHDGPDDPLTQPYGSIGCVEICRGPSGFTLFNDYLISLSGSTKATRDQKLLEIGASGEMRVNYLRATRPQLRTK